MEPLRKLIFAASPITDDQLKALAGTLTWEMQKEFLDATFLHPRLVNQPIARTYQVSILSRLISHLEAADQEIHDSVYELFCRLKTTGGGGGQSEEEFSYRHFLDEDVSIKESTRLITNGTTGLRTWEASSRLLEFVEENRGLFEGKTVLEFGSGVGLVGISIAKRLEVRHVVMSDCHEAVLDVLGENVRLNLSGNEDWRDGKSFRLEFGPKMISVLEVPWEGIQESAVKDLKIDILIGSDIVFDPDLFEPLVSAVKYVFQLNPGCQLFLACTVRRKETLDDFLRFLELEKLSYILLPPSNTYQNVNLYKISCC